MIVTNGSLYILCRDSSAALNTMSVKMEKVKSTKGQIEKILKQRINKSGYPQVNLTQRIGRKKTLTVVVHKLVALAFLDSPSSKPGRDKNCTRILHVDKNKTNNDVTNLKWTKIKDSLT